MKRSIFGFILLILIFTTYNPKNNLLNNEIINIKKIKISNIVISDDEKIKKDLGFLYDANLFTLKTEKISEILKKEPFIESFSIKKVYPYTLELMIIEKKFIAIIQDKKDKFLISDKGDLINFKKTKFNENLPIVFGGKDNFITFYQNLKNIEFPLDSIKSYYFFESGRWDILMNDDKLIKLPIKDYISSVKNFISNKDNKNFKNYKIFDYRIKEQLIIN